MADKPLITDIFRAPGKTFSFEFFPPKTEKGAQSLFASISSLMPLEPSYVSVTFGAGGSTRELTHDLVVRLHTETDLTVVSHLTCVGSTQNEIEGILRNYREHGIRNIMALRGDPPQGAERFEKVDGGFANAAELVRFIRSCCPDTGIGVAGYPEGHPETPNRLQEMDYLKAKVDEGADYIVTQMFFDNNDFFDFCERCELAGITIPIIPGIMPILSSKSMEIMADKAAGVRYPGRLLRALSRATDDDSFAKVGIHWATQQVLDLLDHQAAGIHFYTLNRSKATLQIYDSLGVRSSRQLDT